MNTRRQFLTRSAVTLVALPLAGSALTACSTSWITTAVADIPTAISIADSVSAIIALATGNSLITPAVSASIAIVATAVKAGLLTLQDLINQYQVSKSVTILGKIEDTLTQLLADLSNLLPTLTFADQATKVAITSGVSLLIGVLSAIQVLIPSTLGGSAVVTATRSRRAAANVKLAPATVLPTSAQIKSQFNAVVFLNGYESAIIK